VSARRTIIIDTDPGHDDAFAILTAIASPTELDLLAIATVAGNVPLDKTTYNALRLRELAGAPLLPVYSGCSRPMVNDLVTAEYVHGATGLDGPALPEPNGDVAPEHAVDYLIDTLLETQEPVTVCMLGPMTNVAMALVKEPTIAQKIEEFVIMGGSFHAGGNVTPTAEFNVFVDPHAAHVVFTSGVPMTIMPLDVTHQALATPPRVAAFRDMESPVGDAIAAMLDFVEDYDIAKYGFDGYPLHDPTVVAYLIEPDIFDLRPGHVSVVLEPGLGHGMTVADWWGSTDRKPNAKVALSLDADRFYGLLTERLATL
jgi:purine nucleosidase